MSEEDNNSIKHSKPVTVIVKRIAKKDKIKEFEEWLSGIPMRSLGKMVAWGLI